MVVSSTLYYLLLSINKNSSYYGFIYQRIIWCTHITTRTHTHHQSPTYTHTGAYTKATTPRAPTAHTNQHPAIASTTKKKPQVPTPHTNTVAVRTTHKHTQASTAWTPVPHERQHHTRTSTPPASAPHVNQRTSTHEHWHPTNTGTTREPHPIGKHLTRPTSRWQRQTISPPKTTGTSHFEMTPSNDIAAVNIRHVPLRDDSVVKRYRRRKHLARPTSRWQH